MSYEINHQIGVKASPEEIYKTLTETGWSTRPELIGLGRPQSITVL